MYDDADESYSGNEVEITESHGGATWEPDEVTEPEAWTLEDLDDWLPAFAD